MSVLITFAVRAESQSLRRRLGSRSGVTILETGMGARRAEHAMEAALSQRLPAWVISSGFAGGLNPNLSAGEVVFAADADFPLTARLRAAGAVEVRFRPVQRVLASAEEKRMLRGMTGADAVDMESQVIRACCRKRGIPSATLRVISDAADEDLPLDFNRILTAEFELSYVRLLVTLIRAPGRIRPLLMFRRRVQSAADRLARALSEVIADSQPRVGGPERPAEAH